MHHEEPENALPAVHALAKRGRTLTFRRWREEIARSGARERAWRTSRQPFDTVIDPRCGGKTFESPTDRVEGARDAREKAVSDTSRHRRDEDHAIIL